MVKDVQVAAVSWRSAGTLGRVETAVGEKGEREGSERALSDWEMVSSRAERERRKKSAWEVSW